MPWGDQIPLPLIMGLLVPVSTFFALQSITVPGWLYAPDVKYPGKGEMYVDLMMDSSSQMDSSSVLVNPNKPDKDHIVYIIPPLIVLTLSWIAFGFGLVATVSLFIRMLERKIKWTTRLTIIGSFMQGVIAAGLALTFVCGTIFARKDSNVSLHYTEGIFYITACAACSLTAAMLGRYQLFLNKDQAYEWTMHQLSPSQRQLILLTIMTIGHTVFMAVSYELFEGWDFDDAVYWAVVTETSIGFGDLYPKTILGKLLLPFFASSGVVVVGFNIYALREVVLEIFTLQLAARFSRKFGIGSERVEEERTPRLRHSNSCDDISHVADNGLASHHGHGHKHKRKHHHFTHTPRLRSHSVDESSRSVDDFTTEHNDSPHMSFQDSDEDDVSGAADSPFMTGTEDDAVFSPNLNARGDREPSTPGHASIASSLHRRHRELHRFKSSPHLLPRTMTLSRGAHLPQVTIFGNSAIRRRMVVEETQESFRRQIARAVTLVIGNMVIFGAVFAIFEKWNFWEGLYFTYVSLMTIGYGDYTPKSVFSRSIFIWFIFIGIGSITYLGSMISEKALNQWTVTVKMIERRVDRYEQKAKIKRIYQQDRESRLFQFDAAKDDVHEDKNKTEGVASSTEQITTQQHASTSAEEPTTTTSSDHLIEVDTVLPKPKLIVDDTISPHFMFPISPHGDQLPNTTVSGSGQVPIATTQSKAIPTTSSSVVDDLDHAGRSSSHRHSRHMHRRSISHADAASVVHDGPMSLPAGVSGVVRVTTISPRKTPTLRSLIRTATLPGILSSSVSSFRNTTGGLFSSSENQRGGLGSRDDDRGHGSGSGSLSGSGSGTPVVASSRSRRRRNARDVNDEELAIEDVDNNPTDNLDDDEGDLVSDEESSPVVQFTGEASSSSTSSKRTSGLRAAFARSSNPVRVFSVKSQKGGRNRSSTHSVGWGLGISASLPSSSVLATDTSPPDSAPSERTPLVIPKRT
ncbi:hypothetical protein HDU76_008993 [Blyttiomyces sp. JEL0837]|nr:hypothetical protein HDU76_008993 [Blyttiomyces sp. JEL0837]